MLPNQTDEETVGSIEDITAKAATIKACVRQAIAVEKAGLRITRKTSDSPVPEELRERLRSNPRFKRAFEALTPGGKGVTCTTLPPPSSRRQG